MQTTFFPPIKSYFHMTSKQHQRAQYFPGIYRKGEIDMFEMPQVNTATGLNV